MSWTKATPYLVRGSSDNCTIKNLDAQSSSPFSNISLNSIIVLVETVVFCGVLLIWFKTKTNRSKKSSKVPVASCFPFPVPDFVNGLYFFYKFRIVGLAFAEELISKYGPFSQSPLGFGLETIYNIADPVIVQKILSSTSPSYLNRPREFYDPVFPHEFRNGLLVLEHDLWTNHRKVIANSFNYNSLQAYLHVMNEHGGKLTNKLLYLCSSSETGGVVEGKKVDELICSESIKIILQVALGTDCCSDEESAVIHNFVERQKHITQHRLQNPLLLLQPIWWLHPNRVESEKLFSTVRELLTKKIAMFRAKSKPYRVDTRQPGETEDDDEVDEASKVGDVETKQNCMIENMISSGASDLEIYSEILTLVVAGHETISNALRMMLFHLACNSECQALCRDEVAKMFGRRNMKDKTFSLEMSDIAELKYLERCIFESLRITPAISVFLRRLDSDLEIDEKLTLQKGKTAMISPWAMHHNPDIYPDPEKFDPDRFLPENVQKRHRYAYMPFSHGPRNCIGYKYAILEMKVILAWILHSFDISTTVDPKSVKYFVEVVTLMPDRDLNVVLKRR